MRDTTELATLEIDIMALAASPRRSTRRGEGTVGLAIDIAGVAVNDGDVLVADSDGIVFLDAELGDTIG